MKTSTTEYLKKSMAPILGAAAILLAGCAAMSTTKVVDVTLTGSDEVPSVNSTAIGRGTITVTNDMAVSGSISTRGLGGVAAHIHVGARSENGPIAIGLVKTADNVWSVPAGAKFTEAQYAAFKAGRTYVNVHTPANKGGEIRAQLQP